MKINRKQFYDGYRKAFAPSKDKPLTLTQPQVDGLNFLLDKLEADTFSLEQASYVLATVKHETANTFQPIREKRGKPGTKIRDTQNKYWGTGAYGRGYVQITWPANYKKFGLSTKAEYDKALEPETAYDILSRGMRDGMFTKYKLSDFVNDDLIDYYNARQVVNGLDKANQIADIAEKFEEVIDAATVTEPVTEPQVDPPASPQPKSEVKPQEPEPPAALQAPKPTVTPVEAPPTSITTKVAAGVSAIAPVLTAAGIKIGGIELSTAGVIALSAVIIVGMVIGAWIWNQSQERRERRQRLSMEHLASEVKSNVIAAGSKV